MEEPVSLFLKTFIWIRGNSSLSKIRFSSNKEVVTYQLNMGSGKYKKTVS